MKVEVIAHPRSKKPRIEKDLLGTLHVYVHEPALENKANVAVIFALAKFYNVPISKVVLVKGERSKHKLFEIP